MSQPKLSITELLVAQTIRVFFDESEQHCHYDIHPLQDMELLEIIAMDNGTAPGLRLSVFDKEAQACVYRELDPRLSVEELALLESNQSTGEFAGVEWQLRANLSDGTFWGLTAGNDKKAIEQLKTMLEQMPVQVAIKIAGGALQAVQADRPVEVTLVDEDDREAGGEVPEWDEFDHLQHSGW